ncbi:prepilin-type N-terminal cleavage/methylation domain-containing protein [Bdellovibrio sp. HCB290]|uniref:prepilin-type N-terminal cleavage/methylation domain-containing protein n=1 Tax=Bdellovibrio sp. HCB290 TaxID=3394356 RepID=UPI0039B420FE
MKIRNQKGVTLLEMMVGLGLSAFVILVVVAVQVHMTKEQTELTRQLSDSIDQNLAERIIFKNLNGIEASYNNISVKDNNGNNFYDFYPDLTENVLKVRKDRDFTLSLTAGNSEFFVLTQDFASGAMLNYDPVWAYDVGPEPADPNVPATLDFNASKNRAWISNEKSGGRPGFWRDTNILFFDTPNRIRPVKNGVIDRLVPPRSPFFIGSINVQAGDNLQKISGTAANLFNMTQPASGEAIDSLDSFLRELPSVGGGQTIVRARVVKLIRYSVEPDTKKIAEDYETQPLNLYYTEYRNGSWESKSLLADGVEKMILRRDSVLKRMIYFKIFKSVKKKK